MYHHKALRHNWRCVVNPVCIIEVCWIGKAAIVYNHALPGVVESLAYLMLMVSYNMLSEFVCQLLSDRLRIYTIVPLVSYPPVSGHS